MKAAKWVKMPNAEEQSAKTLGQKNKNLCQNPPKNSSKREKKELNCREDA
jgi:hypothetical protein